MRSLDQHIVTLAMARLNGLALIWPFCRPISKLGGAFGGRARSCRDLGARAVFRSPAGRAAAGRFVRFGGGKA